MHNVQSLVVIASGAGCLVHRPGSVHPVVDDRLLDVHQTIVPIDLNRNTRKAQRLQTGALIRASVLLAAACAPDLSPAEWEALDGYSQDIGLAFQIQDDILDVEGNTEDLGKTIGADAARAKPTYPSVLGLEAAKRRARELQHRACDWLAPFSGRAKILACWPPTSLIVEFSQSAL